MNKDFLLWSNIEILNALDKWGVITVRNLHQQLYSDVTIHGLRRKIHKLAAEDYIHISRLDVKNEMIVLPTKKTLNTLKSNRAVIDESMVYHNLFISLLGLEMMDRKNVIFFNLPHEYRNSRIPAVFRPDSLAGGLALEPDAYLGVEHNDKVFKVAVEIELTQKSSDRVYDKFIQYKDSAFFDYVIYFFKSKSVFNAYKRRLNELILDLADTDEVRKLTGKIIFLYSSQKHQYGSILDTALMECHNRELSKDLFFGPSLRTYTPDQDIYN